jgi:hypothetical protein
MTAKIIFTPGDWTRPGDGIVLKARVAAPERLSKQPPRLLEGHPDTGTVFIGPRQWHKVSQAIKEHRDDKIIVEGHATFIHRQGRSP